MSKFYEQSPLSGKLKKEFEKIPERGGDLSDKVDGIVVEIQNVEDEKEKQKKIEQLLFHIHPLLERTASVFCKRFNDVLLKRGLNKEDVYSHAVEETLKCINLWENQKTRESKGEVSTHFTSFLFNEKILPSRLAKTLVAPIFTGKRSGQEVSMNHPLPGFQQDDSKDLQEFLPDEESENSLARVLKNEEARIGKDAVLNKLYMDRDPYLSLIVILKFGFGKEVLTKWKEKFDVSVKEGKLNKVAKKYAENVDRVIAGYTDDEMTFREIAGLLGNSRQRSQQKFEEALKILNEKLS